MLDQLAERAWSLFAFSLSFCFAAGTSFSFLFLFFVNFPYLLITFLCPPSSCPSPLCKVQIAAAVSPFKTLPRRCRATKGSCVWSLTVSRPWPRPFPFFFVFFFFSSRSDFPPIDNSFNHMLLKMSISTVITVLSIITSFFF